MPLLLYRIYLVLTLILKLTGYDPIHVFIQLRMHKQMLLYQNPLDGDMLTINHTSSYQAFQYSCFSVFRPFFMPCCYYHLFSYPPEIHKNGNDDKVVRLHANIQFRIRYMPNMIICLFSVYVNTIIRQISFHLHDDYIIPDEEIRMNK